MWTFSKGNDTAAPVSIYSSVPRVFRDISRRRRRARANKRQCRRETSKCNVSSLFFLTVRLLALMRVFLDEKLLPGGVCTADVDTVLTTLRQFRKTWKKNNAIEAFVKATGSLSATSPFYPLQNIEPKMVVVLCAMWLCRQGTCT